MSHTIGDVDNNLLIDALLQPEGQTQYLKSRCSNMRGICKKTDQYLNQRPRKTRFPLNVPDIRTDIR